MGLVKLIEIDRSIVRMFNHHSKLWVRELSRIFTIWLASLRRAIEAIGTMNQFVIYLLIVNHVRRVSMSVCPFHLVCLDQYFLSIVFACIHVDLKLECSTSLLETKDKHMKLGIQTPKSTLLWWVKEGLSNPDFLILDLLFEPFYL